MGKVLYVSGSVGLGHIERDMAIAREARRLRPGTEVHWMAGDPARTVLKMNNEVVLPESEGFDQGTDAIEAAGKDYDANLIQVAGEVVGSFTANGKLIWDVAKRGGYDVVAHDEAYEVSCVLYKDRSRQCCKSVFMSDYFGLWGPARGMKNRIAKRVANGLWLKGITKHHDIGTYMLLCERPDIPNERLGMLMPNAQDLVGQDFVKFAGYPLTFDPKALEDRSTLWKKFGIGDEPTILVTIGGTAVGLPLVDLSIKSLPEIRKTLPDARMIVVLGPRADPRTLTVPEGVVIKKYVPELFKLMAACDITICSGGGTTTLELMAMRKPFLYFPLRDHFEQEIIVAGRNQRLGAGVRMEYASTTPVLLAKSVTENLNAKVELPKADFGGVAFAAKEIISQIST
ncbi:MAG TPA: glycosyltransferase [Methanomassiliicoccales archaeon]|nr:glycosyltransferase [Methanomassiliicoccales archaeon]